MSGFTLTTGLNATRALILAVPLCSVNMGKSFKTLRIMQARRSPLYSAQQPVAAVDVGHSGRLNL